MKGRPPIPHERHALEGTLRSDRHPPNAFQIGGRGLPPVPEHLSESAQTAWNEISSSMRESNVLDVADASVLEGACVMWGRAREARLLIEQEGLTAIGARGGTVAHPALKIERDSWALFLRYAEQLGLSPSARARLTAAVRRKVSDSTTWGARSARSYRGTKDQRWRGLPTRINNRASESW